MVAILRTWDQADLKKITVVLTSHSIYENPSFYKDYISQFQLYNYMQGLGPLLQVSNSIIITGELGDQLFGSGILMPACQKYGDEILKSSYIENGARVIDQYTRADSRRGDNYGDVLFEYLKPLADECPFKIQTCFDFFWWFNFTQEWQFAKFKFYESYDVPMSVRYGTNIVHFYDSLEFQKWSISNHDKKIKDGWSSYKQANKEFIYQFTKNDFHLKQLKLQSLKNTYFFQNFRVATTEKHESLDQYSDLEKYAK